MTALVTEKQQSVKYQPKTVKRAERALCCAPFHLALFQTMQNQSVPLQAIGNREGYEQGYTKKPLSEAQAEWELIWLIQVGLLRREVDGQGITDSFRLTPLGRQLVEKFTGKLLPKPSWWEKLVNFVTRWLSVGI